MSHKHALSDTDFKEFKARHGAAMDKAQEAFKVFKAARAEVFEAHRWALLHDDCDTVDNTAEQYTVTDLKQMGLPA